MMTWQAFAGTCFPSKDVHAILGHDTTVNVYTQPIEAGVRQTLDAIYSELVAKSEIGGVA